MPSYFQQTFKIIGKFIMICDESISLPVIYQLRKEKKLDCLRRVLNICWQDMIPNLIVRRMVRGWKNVVAVVEDQQKWFGHVERLEARQWPRKLLHGRVHSVRPRGRPCTTWWTQFTTANSHISPGEGSIEVEVLQKDYSMWDPT